MALPDCMMPTHRGATIGAPYIYVAAWSPDVSADPERRADDLGADLVWQAFVGLVAFDVEQTLHRSLADWEHARPAESYWAPPEAVAAHCQAFLAPHPVLPHVDYLDWYGWGWVKRRDWTAPLIRSLGWSVLFKLDRDRHGAHVWAG
jgi:hypothetical protein